MKLYSWAASVLMALIPAACENASDKRLVNEGNLLVEKIERFRLEHGRLPSKLEDLGVEETQEGPLFYLKRSDDWYVVWFGKGLGESVSYDSRGKRWGRTD